MHTYQTYLCGRIDDFGNGIENGIVDVLLRLLRRAPSILTPRLAVIPARRLDVFWLTDAAVIIRARSRGFARRVFHLKKTRTNRRKRRKRWDTRRRRD